MLEGCFRFINQDHWVNWPPDWSAPGLPKLWQYNLQYFDWLWALDYPEACVAVLDWLRRHPLRRGAVGWEPYPISLRLMNWCALFWGRWRPRTEADPEFLDELWRGVFFQAEWLIRNLETHLLGNHLFENAAALAFVGSCFDGPASARWRRTGIGLLTRELGEQILPDGMHFERSPMYHLRIMQVLEWLQATGDTELVDLVSNPLERMRDVLHKLTHPDGQIALLNDSALGIYPEPGTFLSRSGSREFSQGAWALPQAGYYGYRDAAEGTYLVCDAGAIGPDYIPGHAHADIFSFELSIRGQRVIADAGVHDYVAGEMRRYCRSTRAHNTVEVNGLDQCECWGAFRVARRGYPRDVRFVPDSDGGFTLDGWHDGYHRLPGEPTHYRTFHWNPIEGLYIRDRVTAKNPVQAVSRFHLHPDCKILNAGGGRVRISCSGGQFTVEYPETCRMMIEESLYCPEFNKQIKSQAIAFMASGKEIAFETKINLS